MKRFGVVFLLVFSLMFYPVSVSAAVGHQFDTTFLYYVQLPVGSAMNVPIPAGWNGSDRIVIPTAGSYIVPAALSTEMSYAFTIYDVSAYAYSNQTGSATYYGRLSGAFRLQFQGVSDIYPIDKPSFWNNFGAYSVPGENQLPVTYTYPVSPAGPAIPIFHFYLPYFDDSVSAFRTIASTASSVPVYPFITVLWGSPTPLDFSQFEQNIDIKLVGIASDLTQISSTLGAIHQLDQNGFNQINTNFLNTINVLNQILAKPSGSEGVVTAVDAVTSAVIATGSQIVAEQVKSANQLTGATVDSANKVVSSVNAAQQLITASTDAISAELKRQADANQAAVGTGGDQVSGIINNLKSSYQSKWSALTFPIDFTTRIFSVFQGGSSSAVYSRAYGDVIGYSYDDDTGELFPVRAAPQRAAGARAVNGSSITFPAFSLDLPGVGELNLWDSYTFDISTVKNDFPLLFDALNVISGIILIYATVSFLIDLFEELISH